MRVIISGGGTGGHIYPAIAVANVIRSRVPHAEILFIGGKNGLENDIVPKAGYNISNIRVSYLKRKLSLHNLKSGAMLIGALWQARKIIRKFKPDIVIGTGGFVSGPVVYIASKMGIKTLIHEQNVYPGLTNKILNKYVNKVAISFQESRRHFKNKDNLVLTGNPIRKDFFENPALAEAKKHKSHGGKPLVLIVGGSGGSISINQAVMEMMIDYPQNFFEILLVTGKNHYNKIKNISEKHKGTIGNNKIVEYIDDMAHALKSCDLIVCSAGAITITEINAVGKPAILIPKAYTAENHQEYNARTLEEKGAALVIKEKDLNPRELYNSIKKILTNPKMLESMKKSSLGLSQRHADDLIYDEIIRLL